MSADVIHFFTVNWFGQFIRILAECLLVTVPLLVAVAYMTYVDRKVWASIQLRRGPNVVGPFGLWQPFADGLKLLLKETIVPSSANAVLFILAPMITFMTALIAWAVMPFGDGWVIADINVGILYLFAISSLGADGVLRGLDRFRVHHGPALRRLAQSLPGGDRPVRLVLQLVLAAAAADVRDLLRLGAGRDQPHAVRPADVGSRARPGFPDRIFLDALRPVGPRPIRQHDPAVGDGRRAAPDGVDVPERLADGDLRAHRTG